MARLGGLMAALASGGEAQPNYPTFNKVMMVTGELKEPKRILPVFGFDGRELWPSEVGVKVSVEDEDHEGVRVTGAHVEASFNWKDKTTAHIEGGRHVRIKKPRVVSPIRVNKRIRQDFTLSSDDETDQDFVPTGIFYLY